MTTSFRPPKPNYQDFQDDAWVRGFLRPLLIALLATGLVAGPLSVYRIIAPWRLGYVLPLTFLVALEGGYSTRQLGRPDWRDRRGLVFRLGEVVSLVSLVRLATWLFSLGLPELATLRLWLISPGSFFDDQFIIISALSLLAWGLAVSITGDFLDLAIQADEAAARAGLARGDSRSQLRVFRPLARTDIVGRFAARWIWGGIAVMFFATLSQVSVAGGGQGVPLRIGLSGLGLPAGILVALIGYFLAGLLLLSQARLAVLRGRWFNRGLDVKPSVLRRWPMNSFLILLLVAGVAALLPMASTNWLSTALYAAISLVMRLIYGILLLLMLLLSVLLYPLRFLFMRGQSAPPAPPPAPIGIPSQAETISRLPRWLGGALLWIIVALIAGYLLLGYLRAQGVFQTRWKRWLERWRFWWRARWGRLNATVDVIASTMRDRLGRSRPLSASGTGRTPRVRLGRLPPRQRIRYFYLKAVRRAADLGTVRPPYKTPLEFIVDLEASWPEAKMDVRALTEAFLAARYDRRDIPLSEAHGAQSIWRRVMRALRGRPDSARAVSAGAPPSTDTVRNPPLDY